MSSRGRRHGVESQTRLLHAYVAIDSAARRRHIELRLVEISERLDALESRRRRNTTTIAHHHHVIVVFATRAVVRRL